MNKKLLVASMAGVLGGMVLNTAGAATAVSATGIGQSLMVPYYTAQGNNATLINLVNTSSEAKVVKIRFRGAEYSDDVFDFTLFMSPYDVFTGAVSQNADGGATFATSDASCTLPASVNQDFVTSRVASGDAGTLEGYVEIFVMADLIDDPADDEDLYSKALHANGVAPCGIAVSDLPTDVHPNTGVPGDGLGVGTYDQAVADDGQLGAPTTGLMANVNIVDVPRAAAYSVEATALVDDGDSYRVVFSPQTADQVTANLTSWTADEGLTSAGAVGQVFLAAMYDLPDMSTSMRAAAVGDPVASIDDVSAAIASQYVANEYFTDSSVLAGTDWVFSMPTRRYYVQYDVDGVFDGNNGGTYFTGLDADNTQTLSSFAIYDREEQSLDTDEFVISPGVPSELDLVGEVGVISFNDGGSSSAVLSAELTLQNIDTGSFADGWMSINIGTPEPVIGFSAMRASNNPAGGDSYNFGAAFNHRFY